MPATPTLQIRLTHTERARLQELGRLWGQPDRPLSMADVIRRMMWCDWKPQTNGKKSK